MRDTRFEAYQDVLNEHTVRQITANELRRGARRTESAVEGLAELINRVPEADAPTVLRVDLQAEIRQTDGSTAYYTLALELEEQTEEPTASGHAATDSTPLAAAAAPTDLADRAGAHATTNEPAPLPPDLTPALVVQRPWHSPDVTDPQHQQECPRPADGEPPLPVLDTTTVAEAVLDWFRSHQGQGASIRRVQEALRGTLPRQLDDDEIRIAFRLAKLRDPRLRQATRKSWMWRDDQPPTHDQSQEPLAMIDDPAPSPESTASAVGQ